MQIQKMSMILFGDTKQHKEMHRDKNSDYLMILCLFGRTIPNCSDEGFNLFPS